MIVEDSDKISKIVGELQVAEADFLVCISNMEAIMDKVSSNWESKSSTRYTDIMNDVNLKNLRNLDSTLKDYIDFLNKIPGIYEHMDEVYSSRKING